MPAAIDAPVLDADKIYDGGWKRYVVNNCIKAATLLAFFTTAISTPGLAQQSNPPVFITSKPKHSSYEERQADVDPAGTRPAKAPRCGVPGEDGEIVVCAPDKGEDQRIPSSSQDDPNSRVALRDGSLRPPGFSKPCTGGKPSCIRMGKAPPKVYYFDLKSLPEAAAGSDADKISDGETRAP